MTFLIVHTDHGKYGSEMRGHPSLTRSEIVLDFVSGQFSYNDTRGLLQVFEVSPEIGIATDITAEIARSAWEYIDANSDDCGGNELRLLQEHGLVPGYVERIEGGLYRYEKTPAERSRTYRGITGKAA